MTRPSAVSAQLAGLAVAGAGAVWFASGAGLLPAGAGELALLVAGTAVLVHLMLTVDPAWILSAGVASTMFSGQWDRLGLPSGVAPHRVLLLAGVVAVLLRTNGRERPQIRLGAVHFALAAALAYAVISAIVADTIGRRTSQFVLLDDFGVLPFLMFLVAPVAFATERQRRILLGTLVAVGAYLSVTALLEKLHLYQFVVPGYIGDRFAGTHFGRARGPFLEAGANGLALYACAVAAAIALVFWRVPWQRLCAAAVVVLAPVGLLLTVTRSVWIAGIVATAVAVATTPEMRRLLVPAAVFGTAAVLIAFAVIPGLQKQADDRSNDKAPVYERENTTQAGLRMIADRPLFGYGWDRAHDRLEPYFRLDPNIPLTGLVPGIHNLYLQYGVSLGIVGLGIWLAAAGLALAGAFRTRGPPDVRPWQIGVKAIVVSWLLVGLSTPASYMFSTVLVWTWIGVATGPPLGETAPARAGWRMRRPDGRGIHAAQPLAR